MADTEADTVAADTVAAVTWAADMSEAAISVVRVILEVRAISAAGTSCIMNFMHRQGSIGLAFDRAVST